MRAFIIAHTLILSTPGFIPRYVRKLMRDTYTNLIAARDLRRVGHYIIQVVCVYVHTQIRAATHEADGNNIAAAFFSLLFIYLFIIIIIIYFSVRVIYDRTRYRDRSFFFIRLFFSSCFCTRSRFRDPETYNSSRTTNTTLELFKGKNLFYFFVRGRSTFFVFLVLKMRFLSIPVRPGGLCHTNIVVSSAMDYSRTTNVLKIT